MSHKKEAFFLQFWERIYKGEKSFLEKEIRDPNYMQAIL